MGTPDELSYITHGVFTISGVVQKVQALMNEHDKLNKEIEETEDRVYLKDYIKSVLREALILVFRASPIEQLPVSSFTASDIEQIDNITKADDIPSGKLCTYWSSGKTGSYNRYYRIVLPRNYQYFVALKMKEWVKEQTQVQKPRQAGFAAQYYIYSEGRNRTPRINLVHTYTDRDCLECHPFGGGVEYLLLVQLPQLEGEKNTASPDWNETLLGDDWKVKLPLWIYYAWCYMAAALTYSIYENKESSKEMHSWALQLIARGEDVKASEYGRDEIPSA